MNYQYSTQVASDVDRDGLGLELLDENLDVVAEIFRSDRDHTLLVNTFSYGIPLAAIELLIGRAKEQLEPFEDGTSLSKAALVGPKHVKIPKWCAGL
jgi:hypothetical protein